MKEYQLAAESAAIGVRANENQPTTETPKKSWATPTFEVQKFTPQEFVAVCDNKSADKQYELCGLPLDQVDLTPNGNAYIDDGDGVYGTGDTACGGVRKSYGHENLWKVNGVTYLVLDCKAVRGHVKGYSSNDGELTNVWLSWAFNNHQHHTVGGSEWHKETHAPYVLKSEPIHIPINHS